MPTEIRHILFRPAEVIQAIKDFRRKSNQAFPPVAIFDYAAEHTGPDRTVQVRITLGPAPGETGPQRVVTDTASLIAALILHCRERSIPLSSKAEKSLQILGDQLCLVATINPKQREMPTL